MRPILFSLILMCSGNLYAQEVELLGKFSAFFIGGETIEFRGKDSFYFGGSYCTYGVYGKGVCEIKDNYLYLYFEKTKTKLEPTEPPLKNPVISKSESIDSLSTLKFICVDNDGNPISYGTILLKRKDKITIGVRLDSLGQGVLKIEKDGGPIVITSSAIGVKPVELKLDNTSNYTIQIFHQAYETFNKELNNGETYIYEIDEVSENLIKMRPRRSSERFREYKKKAYE